MKTTTITIILSVIIFCSLKAQTILYSDNFDSYTVGAHLALQSHAAWTTCNHAEGGIEDPVISDVTANSLPYSVFITGGNNLLYEFTEQTSGEFEIDFDYYIPISSNGAYFAVQHFLTPGTEYAFECYFSNDSTGYIVFAGNVYNFTYPINEWFHIKTVINLDQDVVSFYVNNVFISAWPFSFTTAGINGTCKLGSAYFLATSPVGSGTYYLDNFVFTEIVAAGEPDMWINIDSITNYSVSYLEGGDYPFKIKNIGEDILFFKLIPSYDIPNPDPTSIGPTILSNSGDEYTSISPYIIAASIASCFPGELLRNHIGRFINQIDLSIHNVMGAISSKIKIYGQGDQLMIIPGPEIYEQSFTPVEGWNHISLTNPVLIDGSEIAIGAEFIVDSAYIGIGSIGCDSSGTLPYGDWYNYGGGWQRLSITNPELSFNWCLKAIVDGTPINPWMNFDHTSGSIQPQDSLIITTHFGADDIQLNDSKTGKITIISNDPDSLQTTIYVQVNFTLSINENNDLEITLYPNPATENVNITCENIIKVEIYNLSAQKIFEQKYNDTFITIPTNNFKTGTYIVKIFTNKGVASKKVIIQ